MAEKRKFEERKQKHTKLKQLWEERGMVKFEQKFDTISDSVATKIKNKIKKLENEYKIAYEGSIPRVSDGILDKVAERYAELRIVSTYCTEIAGLDVCRFIIRQYFGNMPIRNSAVFSPTNGVFNLFCPLVVDILLESGPELSWDIVE